mgnify:CR=1 FL=1
MTASEAAGMVEGMSPAEFKLAFVRLLEWQAQHGKSLVHLSWYLNCLKYQRDPRPLKATLGTRQAVAALTHGIGQSVAPVGGNAHA